MREDTATSSPQVNYDKAGAGRRIGGVKPLSVRSVERLISSRQLGYYRVGGQIRIPESEIVAYLDRSLQPAVTRRKAA